MKNALRTQGTRSACWRALMRSRKAAVRAAVTATTPAEDLVVAASR